VVKTGEEEKIGILYSLQDELNSEPWFQQKEKFLLVAMGVLAFFVFARSPIVNRQS
jgi:hypothetical protein